MVRQVGGTESLRNTRRSMGDGTLAGRSRISTPFQTTQRRRPAATVIPHTVFASERPLTILLVADDVAVPTGDPVDIEFDEAVVQNLVPWTGPAAELTWPVGGTIMLYVEGAWDDIEPADATVEILVGDSPVWNVSANSLAEGIVLVLQAEDVSVPHATDVDVEFTTAVEQERIGWAGPSDEVVWPVPGVVKFDVAGRWADADPNPNVDIETVQVRVDDEAVWPPSWLPLPGVEVS